MSCRSDESPAPSLSEELYAMLNEILGDMSLDPDPLGTSCASDNDFSADDEDDDPTYHLENEHEPSALRNFYETAHEVVMSTPSTSTNQPNEGNLPSDYSTSSCSATPTITRKRKRNPSLWKQNVRKSLREQGLPFKARSGVVKPGKTMGEACKQSCFYGCSRSITDIEREHTLVFLESYLRRKEDFLWKIHQTRRSKTETKGKQT